MLWELARFFLIAIPALVVAGIPLAIMACVSMRRHAAVPQGRAATPTAIDLVRP